MEVPRRRFLATSSIAALAGCSDRILSDPGTDTSNDTSTETSKNTPTNTTTKTPTETADGDKQPTDAIEGVLEPLPQSIEDHSMDFAQVFKPLPANETTSGGVVSMNSGLADQFGLEAEDVDRMAVAYYDQEVGEGILTITGSFDAEGPNIQEDAYPDETATIRRDGLFVAAHKDESDGWGTGVDAVKSTLDGEAESVTDTESLSTLLEPISGSTTVFLFMSFPPESGWYGSGVDRSNFEGVDSAAVGVDDGGEQQIDVSSVALFQSESDVSEETTWSIAEAIGRDSDSEPSFERDGRRLVATATVEGSATPSTSNSFWADYSADSGTVRLEYHGSEPIDTGTLEIFAGGERVGEPWETKTLEEGDVVEFEAVPFSRIRVEQVEDNDSEVLKRDIATDSTAFDHSYDPESDTITFTYTASQPAVTDYLYLSVTDDYRSLEFDGEDDEPVSKRHSQLESGDEIRVEDVTYGRIIALYTYHDWGSGSTGQSVSVRSIRPPGYFSLTRTDGQPTLRFEAKQTQSASDYRVSVNGDPADTQFTDVGETISEEDSIALDIGTGDTVTVEWVGEDGPIELSEMILRPPVDFEFRRTGDVFELICRTDTSVNSETIELRYGSGQRTVTTNEGQETLTDGDTITIDPEDYSGGIRMFWVGDGDQEIYLGHYSVRNLLSFDLTYEDGTVQLSYAGEGSWPADELTVRVGEETADIQFSSEYQTVEPGDSIEIEAKLGEEITVDWTVPADPVTGFDESAHPEMAFDYDYDADAGELTITSRTDAALDPDALEMRVYTDSSSQPHEVWTDREDDIGAGDSVKIEVSGRPKAVSVVYEDWS
ncbi:MAG: hypothetical protein V5A34_08620, partial [Halapricum sp.]